MKANFVSYGSSGAEDLVACANFVIEAPETRGQRGIERQLIAQPMLLTFLPDYTSTLAAWRWPE